MGQWCLRVLSQHEKPLFWFFLSGVFLVSAYVESKPGDTYHAQVMQNPNLRK